MPRQRSKAIAVLAIAGLLLVGAGCSSSTDKGSSATSDTTTSATATSGNATSDTAGSSTSLGTSGGPTSSGSSGRLPTGVPDAIAMPQGVDLGPWEESTRDGKRVLTIVGTIPDAEGHGPATFEWISAQLVDMGYSVDKTEGEANGRYRATVSGTSDDQSVQVTVSDLAPDIRVDYEVFPKN